MRDAAFADITRAAGGAVAAVPLTARVLHVINGEHYAGAERVQDLLAMRLADFGFEVGFACVKLDRFAAQRQAQQAPLFNVAMHGRLDLRPARRLAAILREHQYALVHTHTPRAALVGHLAGSWAGVPVVHHLHSPTAADSTQRLRNWLNAASERFCVSRAAAVITVSQSLARYARRIGIRASRLCVVHNGVPASRLRRQRRAPTGMWTLGCVALFRPRKGLEVLLHALAELRRRGCPARLRAIGPFETPEYECQIKTLAERLEIDQQIQWTGFVSDVDRELEQIDAFVLPSIFGEGLPMVLLEAMAAGLPVVATRVEGVPEALRDGLDGLVVPPGDAGALADALERLIRGAADARRLGASAQRRQAESFSDQSMVAGVAEVYRRVLAGDGRGAKTRHGDTEQGSAGAGKKSGSENCSPSGNL